MKFLLLKLKLFLKSESLVSIKYGTGYHFVSIDFHEFEIDGIITPTMKICWMKTNNIPHFGILILCSTSKCILWVRLCCQFDDGKSRLKRYNHEFHYPNRLEKSFPYKSRFLKDKISLFKKQKPANLLLALEKE